MIENLKEMMIERLRLFRARRNRYPARVIFYRDGVSESQYDAVVKQEYPQILAAFSALGINPPPKLTLVVVGKRHHTRFYPTSKEHMADGRTGNPKPGSIVDRLVTDVYDFDFFLQAHEGIQGTARPCHYYVLRDSQNFSADSLQQLTNDLSYTFARATRAVSVCTPAYYADIACERGRCYLTKFLSPDNRAELDDLSDADFDAELKAQWDGGPHRRLSASMFYL